MKTTNTFGIIFCIRKSKAKNGIAPIYARITVDGKRCEIALKKNIEIKNWQDAKGFAKPNTSTAKELNTYLEQIRSQLVGYYQELQLKKKLITAVAIKSLFCGTEEKEYTLLNVIDYHNAELSGHLCKRTLGKYFTLKNYISLFLNKKLGTSDIYLSQLTYKLLIDFEMFLKNDYNIGQNSTMKHIMLLRKLITIAINNEWLNHNPFAKYKLSFTKSTRTYLDIEELESIETKEFSIPRLLHVKDLFIFSCYTGLAYIDLYNLTPKNISLGIDGEYWINTTRQKNDQVVRVPLLPKALEIIEKYKTNPAVINSGKLLPDFSNQKLNAYLKEVADVCGITKTLTFHMARHTFATTVTLTNGVPIETVSSMLGHTSIKTTQIYAKVIQQKISTDMKTLRDKMQVSSQKTDTPMHSQAV